MPKLRDYLDSDLDIFLNEDEFASSHIIDGSEIKIVLDNDLLMERKSSSNASGGVYEGEILFHIKGSEYGEAPAIDQRIIFDGNVFYVSDFEENEGMYTITLSRNMS